MDMDSLATQALDIVFKSDTFKDRIKKKATPYVAGILFFNLVLFFMLLYLIYRVVLLEKPSQSGHT